VYIGDIPRETLAKCEFDDRDRSRRIHNERFTMTSIPMRWADEKRNDDKLRCACCDREIKGRHKWVEVIDGGASVADPANLRELLTCRQVIEKRHEVRN
jgi:hypothetical protein